ncbi:MAG TPA: sugar-transfer associated ATP-grasp domain-containing protein [Bacteroidales bacterium]|nr:sugar-transfer associated ATP-grasp domain-containing protein [Bacteroidales bacterium]
MALLTNISKTIRFTPVILKDKRRKSIPRILYELVYLTVYHWSLPSFYFTRRLYMKEKKNILDYLPNRFLYGIAERINDCGAAAVLNDKLFFDMYYSQFTGRLPKILSYNHEKKFIVEGKAYQVNSKGKLEELLKDLTLKRSATGAIFIKKMFDSYGGMNTFRLTKEDFPVTREKLDKLYNSVRISAYLYQDTIVQHPELNRVNPSCINSIRMDTFIDRDGNCDILSAFLRMSISNTHVDNTSSGGCYVGIDLKTGMLKKFGYSSITVTGGQVYTEHPVTGTVFQGFRIPFFEDVKSFVLNIAGINPSLRLIGWDVAVTPRGPVLIEGNCGYDLTGHDMIYGGYRKNPVFRKLLTELNEKKYLK